MYAHTHGEVKLRVIILLIKPLAKQIVTDTAPPHTRVRTLPECIQLWLDWQAFRNDSSVGSCQSWIVTGRLWTDEHLGPF